MPGPFCNQQQRMRILLKLLHQLSPAFALGKSWWEFDENLESRRPSVWIIFGRNFLLLRTSGDCLEKSRFGKRKQRIKKRNSDSFFNSAKRAWLLKNVQAQSGSFFWSGNLGVVVRKLAKALKIMSWALDHKNLVWFLQNGKKAHTHPSILKNFNIPWGLGRIESRRIDKLMRCSHCISDSFGALGWAE